MLQCVAKTPGAGIWDMQVIWARGRRQPGLLPINQRLNDSIQGVTFQVSRNSPWRRAAKGPFDPFYIQLLMEKRSSLALLL